MITTTIYKIIISELIKKGFNYYRDEKTNKIIFLSDDSLLKKILTYDNDVDDIVNNLFFNNNYLQDNDSDVAFKYLWTTRFLNREIKYQSLDLFTTKNTSLFYQYANIILAYFRDYDKYLTNYTENEQTSNSINTSNFTTSTKRKDNTNNNSIISSLPQTEINLDTNNETLDYADSNTISKSKIDSNSNTLSENTNNQQGANKANTRSYDINKLILFKNSNILNGILDDFDKTCFLQIW